MAVKAFEVSGGVRTEIIPLCSACTRSSKGSLSSAERKRRAMGRTALAILALGIGVQTVYMGREWSEDARDFYSHG